MATSTSIKCRIYWGCREAVHTLNTAPLTVEPQWWLLFPNIVVELLPSRRYGLLIFVSTKSVKTEPCRPHFYIKKQAGSFPWPAVARKESKKGRAEHMNGFKQREPETWKTCASAFDALEVKLLPRMAKILLDQHQRWGAFKSNRRGCYLTEIILPGLKNSMQPHAKH